MTKELRETSFPVDVYDDEYIDIEAIRTHFPEGVFIARDKDGYLDEDIWEMYIRTPSYDASEKDIKDWIQLFISSGQAQYHTIDGLVAFYNPKKKLLEVTNELVVKRIEDMDILWEEGINIPSMCDPLEDLGNPASRKRISP